MKLLMLLLTLSSGLLSSQAKIDYSAMTQEQKNNALIHAIKQVQGAEIVHRWIKEFQADPLIFSDGNPLTMLSGNLEVIQMLVEEFGVHIDARNAQDGKTILIKEAYCLTYKLFEGMMPHFYLSKFIVKRAVTVKKLVSLGADVTLRDNDNNTVYYYSAGYPEIANAIREGLAEWNASHPDAIHQDLSLDEQQKEIERSKDYKDPICDQ